MQIFIDLQRCQVALHFHVFSATVCAEIGLTSSSAVQFSLYDYSMLVQICNSRKKALILTV